MVERAVKQFRKLSRPLKLAVQLGVLAVILSTVGAVGFIEYSAQPSFCKKCHNMQPYYDSWATSTHNDVPCIKCHYAPGLRAEAMGKIQAANQVVKYVTGAYGTKPWAEIEDAACLRSGCHSLRKVEGVVSYNPNPGRSDIVVRFDHTQHLGELRRGKQLRCTSCHSQIVQGNHVAVTPETCNLCHFKDAPRDDPVTGCVSCHREPPRIVSPAGFVVDHPQYVRDLVSCTSCHEQVVTGSGAADEARCYTCHNEPDRIEAFGNTTLVHETHIAEHNVECAQCHMPIEHRSVALSQTADLDCASCHRRVHEAQQRLYAGMGGHGTESQPSAMFQARVSCTGCHELTKQVRGHEQVRFAGEASCLSCHGIEYVNILPAWQREMDRKLRAVEPVVRSAERRASSAATGTRAPVDSLLAMARENVRFLEQGKGAHNIGYADKLLRATLDLVREAVRIGKLPYVVPAVDLGPNLGENVCLQCHLGVERRTVPFEGRRFNHERHVIGSGLSCTTCHSPMEDHGKTVVGSGAACSSCHHSTTRPLDCSTCHAGPQGAPVDPVEHTVGAFPHASHTAAGLPCAACHQPPAMDASGVECTQCHDAHHQPEATCANCHREGVKAKHDRSFAHLQCSQCHGEQVAGVTKWTRQVCTTCHVDRVDHNAPVACELCHEVAPLSGGT